MDQQYSDKSYAGIPYSDQYWQVAKYSESLSHNYPVAELQQTSVAHVHQQSEWHVDPYRMHLPHIPITKPMVDVYKSLESYSKLTMPDYGESTPLFKGEINNECQQNVAKELESVEVLNKICAKKQAHQAIREALSKRVMNVSLERPWETAVRRNSVDGQSSPGSSNGSPLVTCDKLPDREDECHKKRPQISYMQLIQMALSSVHDKRMNLQQIYSWVEQNYPFFKLYARKGWKNSVRHNLSLYDIFVREKPDPNDEWKFSYWCLRPENAANGVPNSASKREAERAGKAMAEGKRTPANRGHVYLSGMPTVSDYVVAVPPSMQQSGSRPLLPRSSNDTLAVIPLDYMYQLPPSQTGNFVCAAATPVPNPKFTGSNYDSTPNQTDSGYISLNGSILPVFPGQSFTTEPYKLPDQMPKPRNVVKEAVKRCSGDSGPKRARKSRKSLPYGEEKPKKSKKRTKSAPIKVESAKENVIASLELNDNVVNILEENLSSPLRMLLQSPPQSGNFTSTPYKNKPLGALRVTPIKNVPKNQQSTPRTMSWDYALLSPGGKKEGDVSILSNRSFNLSIPGLTPLKDRENQDVGNVSMNDSLGRLLSDFQYDDHLLDCGVLPIDMDIANGSFLGMVTPTRQHGTLESSIGSASIHGTASSEGPPTLQQL